ncbi:nuclear pore complex protein Nup37 [Acrasis kona]|uniref:Nuclear pore complex protein Nup37 n=1 Tax=Acrasis kona TaxID=1008807 RepID=A0AAW2Z260_9EUKA
MPLINEPVQVVECYPFEDIPSNYIAFSGENTLSVHRYEIKKNDNGEVSCIFLGGEDPESEIYKNNKVVVSTGQSYITAISFAPLDSTQKHLTLCTVNSDRSLNIYQSLGESLKDFELKLTLFEQHSSDINDATFIYDRPEDLKIASGGDDRYLRITSLVNQTLLKERLFQSSITSLDSFGTTLLVAEQNGSLHIFNTQDDLYTQTTIKLSIGANVPSLTSSDPTQSDDEMSTNEEEDTSDRFAVGKPKRTPHNVSPLMDASIHPLYQNIIGCVSGDHYFIYDMGNPKLPLDHGVAHISGAKYFRWAPTLDMTFATGSSYDVVKIWKVKEGQRATVMQTHKQDYRIGGMSWTNYETHANLQQLNKNEIQVGEEAKYCVVGGDRKIHLYVTH